MGQDPEPALSLLRLAQGKVSEANASIRRALDGPAKQPSWGPPPNSDLARLALLPAQVQIALVAGNRDTASKAVEELETLATRIPIVAIRAASAAARGALQLADGEASAATGSLGEALQLWTELDAPYDAARANTVMFIGVVGNRRYHSARG